MTYENWTCHLSFPQIMKSAAACSVHACISPSVERQLLPLLPSDDFLEIKDVMPVKALLHIWFCWNKLFDIVCWKIGIVSLRVSEVASSRTTVKVLFEWGKKSWLQFPNICEEFCSLFVGVHSASSLAVPHCKEHPFAKKHFVQGAVTLTSLLLVQAPACRKTQSKIKATRSKAWFRKFVV